MEKTELIKIIIENQRVINRFMRQEDPDVWMELNLTVAQVKCLFFIVNHSDVNFRILAKALKVTPSNVTGIIDRLSEQDMVVRVVNPQDRRMQMLKLTAKGIKLISNFRGSRIAQMNLLLNQLDEEQLSVIERGFSLLSDRVKKIIEKSSQPT
jgi:MarR family transcriptional regulator, organic hydroperoxide resistance regulator